MGVEEIEMEDELIVEDPTLRQGWFVPLPEVVLFATNLSAEAKVLYGVILTFACGKTNAFPGQERLGRLTGGKDVRTVRRWLRELQKARLLRVERRGLRKTNRYHLLALGQADLPQPPPQTKRNLLTGQICPLLTGQKCPPK